MNRRHILWQLISAILVVSMLVLPVGQAGVSAQASRPEPASPVDGAVTDGKASPSGGPAPAFAFGGSQVSVLGGGNRLANTQNSDGGWAWPLTGGSTLNTVGPIAMGLGKAYQSTGSVTQKAALQKAGGYLLTKTNNFSPSDGYLAAQLDQVFSGNTYKNYVKANYYDPLAAGTYNRNGAGTLYSTASYINTIRTNRASWDQANMAAWDIGTGLVGARLEIL
jgi:hypothetical protein